MNTSATMVNDTTAALCDILPFVLFITLLEHHKESSITKNFTAKAIHMADLGKIVTYIDHAYGQMLMAIQEKRWGDAHMYAQGARLCFEEIEQVAIAEQAKGNNGPEGKE